MFLNAKYMANKTQNYIITLICNNGTKPRASIHLSSRCCSAFCFTPTGLLDHICWQSGAGHRPTHPYHRQVVFCVLTEMNKRQKIDKIAWLYMESILNVTGTYFYFLVPTFICLIVVPCYNGWCGHWHSWQLRIHISLTTLCTCRPTIGYMYSII